MIPLTANQHYLHKDIEKGVTYHLRYITGETVAQFMDFVGEEVDDGDVSGNYRYCAGLVDIFLVGIEQGGNLQRPDGDQKISDMMRLGDVIHVGTVISGLVNELTGIGVEEAKN